MILSLQKTCNHKLSVDEASMVENYIKNSP